MIHTPTYPLRGIPTCVLVLVTLKNFLGVSGSWPRTVADLCIPADSLYNASSGFCGAGRYYGTPGSLCSNMPTAQCCAAGVDYDPDVLEVCDVANLGTLPDNEVVFRCTPSILKLEISRCSYRTFSRPLGFNETNDCLFANQTFSTEWFPIHEHCRFNFGSFNEFHTPTQAQVMAAGGPQNWALANLPIVNLCGNGRNTTVSFLASNIATQSSNMSACALLKDQYGHPISNRSYDLCVPQYGCELCSQFGAYFINPDIRNICNDPSSACANDLLRYTTMCDAENLPVLPNNQVSFRQRLDGSLMIQDVNCSFRGINNFELFDPANLSSLPIFGGVNEGKCLYAANTTINSFRLTQVCTGISWDLQGFSLSQSTVDRDICLNGIPNTLTVSYSCSKLAPECYYDGVNASRVVRNAWPVFVNEVGRPYQKERFISLKDVGIPDMQDCGCDLSKGLSADGTSVDLETACGIDLSSSSLESRLAQACRSICYAIVGCDYAIIPWRSTCLFGSFQESPVFVSSSTGSLVVSKSCSSISSRFLVGGFPESVEFPPCWQPELFPKLNNATFRSTLMQTNDLCPPKFHKQCGWKRFCTSQQMQLPDNEIRVYCTKLGSREVSVNCSYLDSEEWTEGCAPSNKVFATSYRDDCNIGCFNSKPYKVVLDESCADAKTSSPGLVAIPIVVGALLGFIQLYLHRKQEENLIAKGSSTIVSLGMWMQKSSDWISTCIIAIVVGDIYYAALDNPWVPEGTAQITRASMYVVVPFMFLTEWWMRFRLRRESRSFQTVGIVTIETLTGYSTKNDIISSGVLSIRLTSFFMLSLVLPLALMNVSYVQLDPIALFSLIASSIGFAIGAFSLHKQFQSGWVFGNRKVLAWTFRLVVCLDIATTYVVFLRGAGALGFGRQAFPYTMGIESATPVPAWVLIGFCCAIFLLVTFNFGQVLLACCGLVIGVVTTRKNKALICISTILCLLGRVLFVYFLGTYLSAPQGPTLFPLITGASSSDYASLTGDVRVRSALDDSGYYKNYFYGFGALVENYGLYLFGNIGLVTLPILLLMELYSSTRNLDKEESSSSKMIPIA